MSEPQNQSTVCPVHHVNTCGCNDRPPQTTAPVTSDQLVVDDAVIKREARWLREAGHDFAATLIQSLWLELQGRKS